MWLCSCLCDFDPDSRWKIRKRGLKWQTLWYLFSPSDAAKCHSLGLSFTVITNGCAWFVSPPHRHHQGHVPVFGPAGSAGHLPQQQLLRTPDAAAAEQQGDWRPRRFFFCCRWEIKCFFSYENQAIMTDMDKVTQDFTFQKKQIQTRLDP